MPTLSINDSEWTTITATLNYDATDIGTPMPRTVIVGSFNCGWCGISLNPARDPFGFGCAMHQWVRLQRRLLGDPDFAESTANCLNGTSYCLDCLEADDIAPFAVFGYHVGGRPQPRSSNGQFRCSKSPILLSDLLNYSRLLEKLEEIRSQYREVESV